MKKTHKQNQHIKKDEEDISLNFSWIKKLFSKKNDIKKEEKESEEHNEDVAIDIKSVFRFISKYSVVLLILIPLILSVYIRTAPEKMIITDEWARSSIYNNIKNNIASEISKQYPNLPSQNMQSLINEQFNLVLGQQSQAIEQAISQQSLLIRDQFKDSSGNTYLGDIDSYFWLRYAQNIVDKGHMGDELRAGIPYDNHMDAPNGAQITPTIYPYIIAYLYKFIKIFNPKLILMQASFYTPLFLSFLAIIAAFLIGKRLSGNLAGFIAAILIAVNPTVLSRSLGSDNDIVNAVFPLVIMLFTIYAFDSKNIKKMILFTVISGFLLGAYSFAWSGWWFLFLFIFGAAGLYIGYIFAFELLNNKKELKFVFKNQGIRNTFIFLMVFMISCFISLTIFGNQSYFLSSFLNPFRIVEIKAAAKGVNLWPNVYTTVAELNEANLSQIISSLGGMFFFWAALMGGILSLMLVKTDKNTSSINLIYLFLSGIFYAVIIYFSSSNNIDTIALLVLLTFPLIVGLILSLVFNSKADPRHSVLMLIWFVATIYASTKGVRFILLIVPAFVISFSVFFGKTSEELSKFLSSSLDINKNISKVIFVFISLLFLLQPIQNGYATAYSYIPSVNDGWVSSLTKIKQESTPNAIINSWWDFGHWFKYFADRAVTSDGASQNSPQAHWVGKVLLTSNETQAIAILRMLDCGSNNAFDILNKELNNTHESVKQIYKLFSMNPLEGKKELLKITTEEVADKIVSSLYCTAPEDYFITSEDMVGKSGVWAHFGIWNFERADIYNFFQTNSYDGFIKSLKEEYNYSEEEAKKKYYEISALSSDREINDWIAPWPSYGGVIGCSKNKEGDLQCNIPTSSTQAIPLQINMTSKEAFVYSTQGTYYPSAFGYVNGENMVIKKYDKNSIGYAVLLLEDNSTIVIMDENLVGSIFTRLFYLDGKGLKSFQKFEDIRDITGSRIITWKIDWPT